MPTVCTGIFSGKTHSHGSYRPFLLDFSLHDVLTEYMGDVEAHQQVAPPTAADLRAALARRRVTLYKLASDVGVHPGRLGQILNERLPLPEGLGERILRAVDGER